MKQIISLGIVKGFFYQILGTAVGYGFLTVVRIIMGLPYKVEPAAVFGGLLGA